MTCNNSNTLKPVLFPLTRTYGSKGTSIMGGQALIIYQLSNIPVGEYLANARMFWPSRQVRTVRMVYSSCPINSDAVANLIFFCSRLFCERFLKRDHVTGQQTNNQRQCLPNTVPDFRAQPFRPSASLNV